MNSAIDKYGKLPNKDTKKERKSLQEDNPLIINILLEKWRL